eukprot:346254-Pelagomonas_calceolata.AAC.4
MFSAWHRVEDDGERSGTGGDMLLHCAYKIVSLNTAAPAKRMLKASGRTASTVSKEMHESGRKIRCAFSAAAAAAANARQRSRQMVMHYALHLSIHHSQYTLTHYISASSMLHIPFRSEEQNTATRNSQVPGVRHGNHERKGDTRGGGMIAPRGGGMVLTSERGTQEVMA